MKNKTKTTSKNTKTSLTIGLSTILIALVVLFANNSVTVSALQSNDIGNQNAIMQQKLENAKDIVTKDLIDKRTLEIPTIATYVDESNSSLVVVIDDKSSLEKQVYHDRLISLLGKIPLTVEFGHMEFQTCDTQGSACTPIIGGIVTQTATSPGGSSTLNLGATTNSAKKGFIMSGHAAGCSANIGTEVGQNFLSIRKVGNVLTNPPNNRFSDSAFVEFKKDAGGNYLYTSDQSKIYRGANLSYNILGKTTSTQTPVGTTVKIMGWSTNHIESGSINLKGVNVSNTLCGGTLTNQVRATYASLNGDSGAPIFSSPDGSNNIYYYGIHVGRLTVSGTSYAIYSPWEGIQTDLSLQS